MNGEIEKYRKSENLKEPNDEDVGNKEQITSLRQDQFLPLYEHYHSHTMSSIPSGTFVNNVILSSPNEALLLETNNYTLLCANATTTVLLSELLQSCTKNIQLLDGNDSSSNNKNGEDRKDTGKASLSTIESISNQLLPLKCPFVPPPSAICHFTVDDFAVVVECRRIEWLADTPNRAEVE
ncbi:uncharacterized protein MONOS_9159 [Monocercomonoides exilis]|uniref:uncharacterized protein n=1 Tax=Monocercomonoides exilis TaxID=2049356 RepID=UPI00355ABE5A|nr:hypothetical protein MONOS_9159 [Monocercomonoides exilis]|eukprot:MONOS_9159.1-p1 / transcript=MONOS_9159.1 / gene=MONOS_9159 / organism=Monocercomonoides_exilis_PA203 / gene_product=unspecified product / transcript_product=unspecified product / location=Mono_scaffold00369:27070-27612(-) / protein_length=181 / sequence_SO=supercontig / SO=protein_coding / is_pseudo=false